MPSTSENNDFSSPLNGLPQYVQHDYNPSSPDTAFYAASPVGSATKGRKPGVDALEALRSLPRVRPIPWMPGKKLPPEKSTDSPRSQTRGAFLLATRGQIRNPPCTHCATGVGRFSVCISLEGWFRGACSTCQMGTRGNLCSLRKDAEEDSPFTPNKAPEPQVTQSSVTNANHPTSSLKRKRESPAMMADAAAGPPPKAPYPAPINGTETTLRAPLNPTASYTIPPNHIPQGDSSALLDYVYEKQYPPNGTKRHQILYRARSNPREAGNGTSPPALNADTMGGAGRTSIGEVGRDVSNSLSPSTQFQAFENPFRSSGVAAQGEVRNVGHPATPLIDTLPRKKQKQIYQIIGGVQSGIRSVRQQTESLQKQLDLLQAALGIDADDENDASLI